MPSELVELAQAKKNGKARGSGKVSRYERKQALPGVRWRDVDASAIGECVHAVTSVGDAILFGAGNAGSVLVITVCSGERRIKFYARSVDEAIEHLAEIENAASAEDGP